MKDPEKITRTKRRAWLCFAAFWGLFLTGLVSCLFLPPPTIDESKVHPELLKSSKNATSVEAVYYMDGGSQGAVFANSEGATTTFAELSRLSGYPQSGKLFFGPSDSFTENRIDELIYPNCREFIAQQLAKNGVHDRLEFFVIFDFSQSFPTKIRALLR